MTLLRRIYLYLKLYIYWHFSGSIRRYYTVSKMFIMREKRLYYLYASKQLIEVTAFNYLSKIKMDGAEFALIEFRNTQGEKSWCKAERF